MAMYSIFITLIIIIQIISIRKVNYKLTNNHGILYIYYYSNGFKIITFCCFILYNF